VRSGPLPWIVGALGVVMVAALAWRAMSSGEARREERIVVPPSAQHDAPAPKGPWRTRSTDSLAPPAYGTYVHIDELPEAITKVAPAYPDEAREQGTEGMAIVQALVGRDGLVVDARVVQPSPPFDEAALAAVREWTFKPARSNGKPVAVWVAVPVKFTLR
jgi:protein TonB